MLRKFCNFQHGRHLCNLDKIRNVKKLYPFAREIKEHHEIFADEKCKGLSNLQTNITFLRIVVD